MIRKCPRRRCLPRRHRSRRVLAASASPPAAENNHESDTADAMEAGRSAFASALRSASSSARDADHRIGTCDREMYRREAYESLWATMRAIQALWPSIRKSPYTEDGMEALVDAVYLLSGARRTLDASLYWATNHHDYVKMTMSRRRNGDAGGGDSVGCMDVLLRGILEHAKLGRKSMSGAMLQKLLKSMVQVDANLAQMKRRIGRRRSGIGYLPDSIGAKIDTSGLHRVFESSDLVIALCCDHFSSGIAAESFERDYLAGMAWALGKMRRSPGVDTMNAFAEQLTRRDDGGGETASSTIAKMDGTGMALVTWFFGRILYLPSTACLAELERASRERMALLSGHSLSLIMWGFATIGVRPQTEWLEAAAAHAAKNVDWSNSHSYELSNIVWSLASLQFIPSEPILHALVDEAVFKLAREDSFDTRSISNILWSLTKLSLASANHASGPAQAETPPTRIRPRLWQPSDELIVELTNNFGERLASSEGNQQDVANALWSFAKLEFDPEQACLDGIRVTLEKRATKLMRPAEAKMCITSLAALDYKPGPKAMYLLCVAVLRNLARLHAKDLYAILRSLTKLGVDPGESWCRDVYSRIQRYSSESEEKTLTKSEKKNLAAIFDTLGHASVATSASTASPAALDPPMPDTPMPDTPAG